MVQGLTKTTGSREVSKYRQQLNEIDKIYRRQTLFLIVFFRRSSCVLARAPGCPRAMAAECAGRTDFVWQKPRAGHWTPGCCLHYLVADLGQSILLPKCPPCFMQALYRCKPGSVVAQEFLAWQRSLVGNPDTDGQFPKTLKCSPLEAIVKT